MQTVTKEWLQSIESLKDVPLAQLQWFIDNSRHYELAEGEFLIKNGEPLTGTHIIISGRIKMYLTQNRGMRDVRFIESKRDYRLPAFFERACFQCEWSGSGGGTGDDIPD